MASKLDMMRAPPRRPRPVRRAAGDPTGPGEGCAMGIVGLALRLMPASLPESPRPPEAGRESPEASAAESRPGSTRSGTSGLGGLLAFLRRIPATARWPLKPGGRLSYRHLTGQDSGVTTTRITHLLDHLLSRVPENLLRSRGGCKGGGARRGGAAEDIVLERRVEADARIFGDDL